MLNIKYLEVIRMRSLPKGLLVFIVISITASLLVGCSSTGKYSTVQESQEIYSKGIEAFEAKKFDEARTYLIQVPQSNPNYENAQEIILAIEKHQSQEIILQNALNQVKDYLESSNNTQVEQMSEIRFSEFKSQLVENKMIICEFTITNSSNSPIKWFIQDFVLRKEGQNTLEASNCVILNGREPVEVFSKTMYPGDSMRIALYYLSPIDITDNNGYILCYINTFGYYGSKRDELIPIYRT